MVDDGRWRRGWRAEYHRDWAKWTKDGGKQAHRCQTSFFCLTRLFAAVLSERSWRRGHGMGGPG